MSGKLNCRPGDLAIIVGADSATGQRSLGKIVRVLEPARSGRHHGASFDRVRPTSWFIEFAGGPSPAPLLQGGEIMTRVAVTRDANLRPIRDQPGEDETLQWAGLPKYRESHVAIEAVAREVLETFEGAAA